MNDRPTSETESRVNSVTIENQDSCCAIYVKIDGIEYEGPIVDAEFAYQLERQRNEALSLARELRDVLNAIVEQDAENFELGYQALGPFVVQTARNAIVKAKEVLP